MKKSIFLILTVFVLTAFLSAQTSIAAPHGGSIKTADNYKVEMVDCYEYVEVYLYELDMCPVLNRGFSGQIDFYFPNNDCYSSKLYYYGVDAFTAEVTQHCYTGCSVNLHGVGVSIKAEFSGFSDADEDCKSPNKSQTQK